MEKKKKNRGWNKITTTTMQRGIWKKIQIKKKITMK